MLKNVSMQELQDLMANLLVTSVATEKQLATTDARLEKQFVKNDEKLKKQIAETDAELKKQLEERDKRSAKTDAKLDKVAKMIGGISNNQGDIAEEFFVNSLASSKKIAGIQYDMLYKNLSKIYKNTQDEYDIVLVNGKDIIIEVKYKAHKTDLESLIGRKYANFKKLYPEYTNYTHHLGLASFHINDELKNQALDNGVIILQRKGDVIETFKPK